MGSTPVFALAVLRKNTPASLIITRFPETALSNRTVQDAQFLPDRCQSCDRLSYRRSCNRRASIPASPTDVVGRANTGLLTPMVVLNSDYPRQFFTICPT